MTVSKLFKKSFTKKNIHFIYGTKILYSAYKGTDGIDKDKFQKNINSNINSLYKKIKDGTYKFITYKARLIVRGQYKSPRKIERPCIKDKIILRIIYDLLRSIYEEKIKFRGLHSQIKNLIMHIKNHTYDTILRYDIKDFFPSVIHETLIEQLKKKIKLQQLIELIEKSIKNPSDIDKKEGKKINIKGIPQGLSISNLLANIYLFQLDSHYHTYNDIIYFRYVDDIAILCNHKNCVQIENDIINQLNLIGLTLNTEPEKKYIKNINENYQYLGYAFINGTVSVRKSSSHTILKSLIGLITAFKRNRYKSESIVIFKINLRITGCISENKKYGWMFYFSQMDDHKLLHSLDHAIGKQLEKNNIDKIKIKSFVKTKYEIEKNLRRTKYIPNFDLYSIDEKRKVLYEMKISVSDEIDVEIKFLKLIRKEISDIERDMAELS